MRSTFLLKILIPASFLIPAAMQADLIPATDVLQELIAGNERYIIGDLLHPNRCYVRRQEIFGQQMPFAIVLSCADSRVTPEIIFDQGLGDLFVVRVAGNVAGPFELSSIEFAAKNFNSSLIMVLGHKNCGLVKAVLEGNYQDVAVIADVVKPAVEQSKTLKGDPLENAIKMNVKFVVEQLRNNPVIIEAMKTRHISIVGGYYDLNCGKVEIIK